MAERRYKGTKVYGKAENEVFIKDRKNDYYYHTEEMVVDLLNKLDEENELLRQRNGELIHDCYGHLYSIRRVQDENKQLKSLLKEAEDEIENLKKSNKGLMESIVEKDEQINKLKKEVDEYKEAIINKVQYYEDIEDFAIKKGLIKKDWAKFDGYD